MLCLYTVSAKRKRQEDFQSRKRQAQGPVSASALPSQAVTQGTSSPICATAQVEGVDTGRSSPQKALSSAAAGLPTDSHDVNMADPSPMSAANDRQTLPKGSEEQLPGLGETASALPDTAAQPHTHTVGPETAGDPMHNNSKGPITAQNAVAATVPHKQVQSHSVPDPELPGQAGEHGTPSEARAPAVELAAQKYVFAKPVNDARGHTGYLTFARRSVDD